MNESGGTTVDAGDRFDWEALRVAARGAMEKAYAPYSSFKVGAAAFVDDGRLVTGANIENAAYGVTLCAECSLVSDLIGSGAVASWRSRASTVTATRSCRAGGAASSCGSTAAPHCSSRRPVASSP